MKEITVEICDNEREDFEEVIKKVASVVRLVGVYRESNMTQNFEINGLRKALAEAQAPRFDWDAGNDPIKNPPKNPQRVLIVVKPDPWYTNIVFIATYNGEEFYGQSLSWKPEQVVRWFPTPVSEEKGVSDVT
jgi:hypothetical protein